MCISTSQRFYVYSLCISTVRSVILVVAEIIDVDSEPSIREHMIFFRSETENSKLENGNTICSHTFVPDFLLSIKYLLHIIKN